jgi:hypothetical protein
VRVEVAVHTVKLAHCAYPWTGQCTLSRDRIASGPDNVRLCSVLWGCAAMPFVFACSSIIEGSLCIDLKRVPLQHFTDVAYKAPGVAAELLSCSSTPCRPLFLCEYVPGGWKCKQCLQNASRPMRCPRCDVSAS